MKVTPAAVVSVFLLWALLFSIPPAQATGLSLDDAVQAALARSPAVELARLQALQAELNLLAAQLEKDQGKRLEYLEAQRALEEAQSALRAAAAEAAVQAEEAFYNVLRTGELLELFRRAAAQAETQVAIARARHESGMLSRLDLMEVELASERAAARLNNAQREHDAARLALSAMTGHSPLPPLVRPEEPPLEEASLLLRELDWEAAVARALSHHGEIAAARLALQSAQQRLELARLSDAPPVEIRRAEIEVQQAAIRLEEAEARIRQALRDSRDALLAAASERTLREKELALALQRFEVANARYKAGDLSLMDLFAAEDRVMEARLDAATALWDYNVKKARFLRLIDETATKTHNLPSTGGFGLYLHE